jgi:hypothetical protein
MSSLLTSEALVQRCYTNSPLQKNILVKLNGYNADTGLPVVSPISNNNDKSLGLVVETINTPGKIEVLFKGITDLLPLPSGSFVGSEIYWDINTGNFTSENTPHFIGRVAEAFPYQKVYVDILNSEDSDFKSVAEKVNITLPMPVSGFPTPTGVSITEEVVIIDGIFEEDVTALYEIFEPTSGITGVYTYIKFNFEPDSNSLILRESSENVSLVNEENKVCVLVENIPLLGDKVVIKNNYNFDMPVTCLRFR